MTLAGIATVDAIAALPALQRIRFGSGSGDMTGGSGFGITTGATIRINILTQGLPNSGTSLGPNTGKRLQTQRYNAIRAQLINDGIPAANIQRGTTLYNQAMGVMGGVNQVQFIITPFTRTTQTTTTIR